MWVEETRGDDNMKEASAMKKENAAKRRVESHGCSGEY
jgi:hypothetical protein